MIHHASLLKRLVHQRSSRGLVEYWTTSTSFLLFQRHRTTAHIRLKKLGWVLDNTDRVVYILFSANIIIWYPFVDQYEGVAVYASTSSLWSLNSIGCWIRWWWSNPRYSSGQAAERKSQIHSSKAESPQLRGYRVSVLYLFFFKFLNPCSTFDYGSSPSEPKSWQSLELRKPNFKTWATRGVQTQVPLLQLLMILQYCELLREL